VLYTAFAENPISFLFRQLELSGFLSCVGEEKVDFSVKTE